MNHTDGQATEPRADTGAQRLAEVYAEALLDAAARKGQADEALDELDALVRDLFRADARLEAFLNNHALGRDQKRAALHRLFDGRASESLRNFLQVLNDHDRLDLLRPILAAARELQNRRANRVRVRVRSAVPLSDEQRGRLVSQLRDRLRMEPQLETQVDPDLLGGLVVRVGDWVYDASVRTRLDNIRNQLIERSSHEIQSRRDRFSSDPGD